MAGQNALNELCAAQLRVLADQTRLAVINQLLNGPMNVRDINRKIRVSQSLLSHHLRILRDARLVTTRRCGKSVVYQLAARVALAPAGRGIDLGCCQLAFDAQGNRKYGQ
jgi:ArsR family transcriptional regulator